MEFWRDINWYAIQSKPEREDLAAYNLGRLGLEVFLPKMKLPRLCWGVCQMSVRPLFPGYLFARFSPSSYLHLIKYARGVRRVVSCGEAVLPVDEGIIEAIQIRLEGGQEQLPEPPRHFRAGEQVRVEKGYLQGLIGIFERELSDQQRVVILLEAIEYQARVAIEKRYLTSTEVLCQ